MKKLLIFDADGVLLDTVAGGFKQVLHSFGKQKEVDLIDEEYQKIKHLGPWGLDQLAALYIGISQKELQAKASEFVSQNMMPGAQSVIQSAREKNYTIGVVSSNPEFILNEIQQQLSLDFSHGNKLDYQEGICSGNLSRKVDRYGKAAFVESKIQELVLTKDQVVVVGDSITDLPMAEHAGTFIAFNAQKDEVKNAATHVVDSKDLKDIIQYL